jgi:hypothetical protein
MNVDLNPIRAGMADTPEEAVYIWAFDSWVRSGEYSDRSRADSGTAGIKG